MINIDKKDVWIQTYSGKKFYFLDPEQESIDIKDIAHGLSQLCRFTGQSRKFMSVAEHCVRVAMIVPPEYQYAALMHDASEAYLGDISRPLKKLLLLYQDIESIVQAAICKRMQIPEVDYSVIKKADNVMLATEARDLMMTTDNWYLPEEPLPQHITNTLSAPRAKATFIKLFLKLAPLEPKERYIGYRFYQEAINVDNTRPVSCF